MLMLLPRFEYYEPKSLEEAYGLLADLGEEAKILAGGTDLLVNMKKKLIAPKNIVSLRKVQGLDKIEEFDDYLLIGCRVTATEVAESPLVNKYFSLLAEGAGSIGSPQVRNRATIAGNVVNARPAADSLPSLIALNAQLILESSDGERIVSVEDFVKGPGKTDIKPGEILKAIKIEKLPANASGAYVKFGERNALEISLVGAAAVLIMEEDGKKMKIKDARIVMSSVGPKPLRALKAEEHLKGSEPAEDLFKKAGQIASEECSPITDYRASAEYKRIMAGVHVRRALVRAYSKIMNS